MEANQTSVKPLFIVVEGLDATGKTTLVDFLISSLQAHHIKCPPKLTTPILGEVDLRDHFDQQSPVVRRAYYRSANLVASELSIKARNNGQNVVMDRYWPSTISYSALDGPHDSVEWGYPIELQKPDFVLFLFVNEKTRVERMKGRGQTITAEEENLENNTIARQKIVTSYRRFANAEIDTSNMTPEEVHGKALVEIRKLFFWV